MGKRACGCRCPAGPVNSPAGDGRGAPRRASRCVPAASTDAGTSSRIGDRNVQTCHRAREPGRQRRTDDHDSVLRWIRRFPLDVARSGLYGTGTARCRCPAGAVPRQCCQCCRSRPAMPDGRSRRRTTGLCSRRSRFRSRNWPIASTAQVVLPAGGLAGESKMAVHARIDAPGGALPVFTTHLTYGPGLSQVRTAQPAPWRSSSPGTRPIALPAGEHRRPQRRARLGRTAAAWRAADQPGGAGTGAHRRLAVRQAR